MRRYAIISLAIGGGAALVALLFYFLGGFHPLAAWLSELYLSKGIFPSEEFLRAKWLEILVVVLLSFGVSWCVIDISPVALKLLVVLCAFLVVGGLSVTSALHGFFFEPFSSFAALVLVAATGFVFAGTERGMRKRVLEEVIGSRISRNKFDALLEAVDPPNFGGAVNEVSVLTCRLFNHAELQEKLESGELIKLSNLFLRSVSTFLASRGAYLDESGPELVRGYFGMLEASETHAEDACRAALELRSRLRNLSQECETRWFQPIQYGIGISSGPMTVGVYGSQEHRYFSGIGPETDYARRLAHANQRYGSDILVGPLTHKLLSDQIEVRPMEMFYDPEANAMTEVYQLLALTEGFPAEDRQRRDRFWEGVIRFREKEYEKALDAFSQAKKAGEEDGPLEFFVERCQSGLAGEDVQPDDGKPKPNGGHARLLNLM